MAGGKVDISVVIVNYKVREYIANLLNSIQKAKHDLELEIFVVDNNSEDGSVEFLKTRFPDVRYIENDVNLGFGKANNQAIKLASGTYTLLINPDTLVSEDTLTVMKEHMDSEPHCGAAGCRILNPDGTFAPESRRSVPTIWSSLTRISGLNTLLPDSKTFGQYYLSWMKEDEKTRVPVLSGSFMFWRTEVLKDLGGFDERFFMYGEDIDLCYRIQDTDHHITYVPDTSIIHYKGESSKKGDLRYVRIFNKALYQFFDKHYSTKYSLFFKTFIFGAIWLKAGLSFITGNLRTIGLVATELAILNVSVITGFLLRFEFSYEVLSDIRNFRFLWINVLISVIYLLTGSYLNLYRSNKESVSNQIKALVTSYAGVVLITFFIRDYAFSRLALLVGGTIGVILMIVYKLLQINLSNSSTNTAGKLKKTRIAVVGDPDDTVDVISRIHARPDWNYEVVGLISTGESTNEAIGTTHQLKELIKVYNIDQIFFALKSITYKEMLGHIKLLQQEEVVFKLLPDSMEFILGKSNVEYLEHIPLVSVELSYNKGVNRFLKRLTDVMVSASFLLVCTPVLLPLVLTGNRTLEFSGMSYFKPASQHRWKNRFIGFWNVFKGSLSLVGSTLPGSGSDNTVLKPGLTGPVQVNKRIVAGEAEQENYELYYLQNYSLWMDIDILLKTLIQGSSFSDELERIANKGARS